MYSVKKFLTYFMSNILFAAETVVDKLSDEHISSPCPPAVKGKGAFHISPTGKKTKTSLKNQTRTSSPVCDLGEKKCLFFKQAIYCKI